MEQVDFLRHTVELLDRLGIAYTVVGSYGCLAYGEPRFTQDIDIVLDLPPQSIAGFCAGFPSGDFDISEPAVREAVHKRFQFNVLHPASGNKIDFILPRDDDWGRTLISRRRQVRLLPDRDVPTASPEDVILGKLWYYAEGGSDKHLRDIASILKVSGEGVDREEVRRWAEKLGYTAIWESVLERLLDS
jgi:hypothetical protein